MYLLNKSGLTTSIVADKEAAVKAIVNSPFLTGASMYQPPQSNTISFTDSNGTKRTVTISFSKTTDVSAEVLNGKIGFLRTISSNGGSHFVLVDGIDSNSQPSTSDPDNFKKHLVVDPADGTSKTLYDAIRYSLGSKMTPTLSNINPTWRCVFN